MLCFFSLCLKPETKGRCRVCTFRLSHLSQLSHFFVILLFNLTIPFQSVCLFSQLVCLLFISIVQSRLSLCFLSSTFHFEFLFFFSFRNTKLSDFFSLFAKLFPLSLINLLFSFFLITQNYSNPKAIN